MQTEIEAKFLSVNHDVIREKLKSLGAVCKEPMHLMRRVTFDNAHMKASGGWIRVRDEGNKIVLTYKQVTQRSLDGVQEVEVIVSDFQDAVSIMRAIGLDGGSYQESKRESWVIDTVKVELDEWPWLNPYIELEGTSESAVKALADKLGLDWKEAQFGDVNIAYKMQYTGLKPEFSIGDLPEVMFELPLPKVLGGAV